MAVPAALTEDQIYHRCPIEKLDFESTDALDDLELPVGQERMLRALEFGASMKASGFNLFVLGPAGAGKHELVKRFLSQHAAGLPAPADWCHVFNFKVPDKPCAIKIPPGEGRSFKNDMNDLVSELKTAIPATFESEEYQARIQELQEEVAKRQSEGLFEIQEEANRNNIAMLATHAGFTFAPMRNGEVIDPEEYKNFSDDEKELVESKVEELQKKLQQAIQQVPRLRKEVRQRIHELNEEMVQLTLGGPMGELREKWRHVPAVVEHLDAVREDIVEHAEAFQDGEDGPPAGLLNRYRVNLLVDNAETEGAPVVYEDLPSHQHLSGQIEHRARQGNLYTDFTLIRPGSLHRANGGYLIIDARRILTQPMAWESLKRILFSGEIRIESLERLYGLATTVSQQPEPIPLSVKVVLLGDRMLYYLLSHYDPDFLDLFKVEADFEDDLDRDESSYALYARMLATMARSAGLRPLDKTGVGRLIEHASRLASDQKKLTAHDRVLKDLLSEADHWAGQAGSERIEAAHIQQAIDEREYRASRIRERSLEQIQRGVVMIATTGEHVGQVNGLSVLQIGATRFGQPTRITATARPGKGQVADIEREAKLGGPIHSKAVMILSRFLANRYAPMGQLSLSASLAFEQSYGGVEGDSASVAETCVLLSAITGVPLKQSLAVTGSMNQHGEVQAVGGVNEKIEGFFNVCRQAGDVNGQGALLPASNVEHLMLNEAVRAVVRDVRFSIYPISHIDQAIELMTGLQAGEADSEGVFPEGSFNRLVADRLEAFAKAAEHKDDNGDTDGHGDGDDD
ncbi:Lon protease family protein [Marinobacter persicus]|jgi:lon-related putative ATP-dependent protease|uniref:endopeptidase La n=1 Tax=Marinobacter persicus TaxID=930118 RepID=A0A2S6G441_9GAMM|nr:ATP-binding protein [Marinobacter persicus]PPK50575.1 lon-related putative ATP-dependent protease [Marinobacter persicus]PPK53850.1 lon-related putative ATP-dependent protease [Marinobacter persicus]PPK57086.1 lon-related putative ATP-dependent protease [Marinobacter persicus]